MLTLCSNHQLTLNTRFPIFGGRKVRKHLEQIEGTEEN